MNAYELADELNRIVKVSMPLHYITESANMLRQQADRIADYEKWEKRWSERVARAENRIAELEKDLALKTRDRDVFREFTLAYEKRIAELQEVNGRFVDLIKSLRDEVNKLRGEVK